MGFKDYMYGGKKNKGKFRDFERDCVTQERRQRRHWYIRYNEEGEDLQIEDNQVEKEWTEKKQSDRKGSRINRVKCVT